MFEKYQKNVTSIGVPDVNKQNGSSRDARKAKKKSLDCWINWIIMK